MSKHLQGPKGRRWAVSLYLIPLLPLAITLVVAGVLYWGWEAPAGTRPEQPVVAEGAESLPQDGARPLVRLTPPEIRRGEPGRPSREFSLINAATWGEPTIEEIRNGEGLHSMLLAIGIVFALINTLFFTGGCFSLLKDSMATARLGLVKTAIGLSFLALSGLALWLYLVVNGSAEPGLGLARLRLGHDEHEAFAIVSFLLFLIIDLVFFYDYRRLASETERARVKQERIAGNLPPGEVKEEIDVEVLCMQAKIGALSVQRRSALAQVVLIDLPVLAGALAVAFVAQQAPAEELISTAGGAAGRVFLDGLAAGSLATQLVYSQLAYVAVALYSARLMRQVSVQSEIAVDRRRTDRRSFR